MAEGRFKDDAGRVREILLRGGDDGGDQPHAGEGVREVGFLREARLGEEEKHAVADVVRVDAGIGRIGLGVLVEPNRGIELVDEEVEVDALVGGELGAVDGLREFRARSFEVRERTGERGGREIVEFVVEAMVAELRGFERVERETLVEVPAEKCFERRIGGGEEGGDEGRGGDGEQRAEREGRHGEKKDQSVSRRVAKVTPPPPSASQPQRRVALSFHQRKRPVAIQASVATENRSTKQAQRWFSGPPWP